MVDGSLQQVLGALFFLQEGQAGVKRMLCSKQQGCQFSRAWRDA